MLVLAGVTGTGKTTIAERLAERLGLEYIAIDTSECHSLTGTRRQLCFLDRVARITLLPHNRAVADNSLLSVYAYTVTLAARGVLEAPRELVRLAKKLALAEAKLHKVVVIFTPPLDLRKRWRARVERGERRSDVYAGDEALHFDAQDIIMKFATRHGIPVVVNTLLEEAVREAERIARSG